MEEDYTSDVGGITLVTTAHIIMAVGGATL